ncbi:MAG TPA: hypothetical protein VFD90_18850 [Gaiellales bacterium]|jgi:hypothetical protein|nr:hypothetical protein [Gaiellales bacterium]
MPSTAHRAHECAICRRSFLAGETVRLYRDHPSRAAVRVCELCPSTAEARGWMPAESTGRRLRMPADPGRLELAERRDALVERLTGQLATLEEELEQARGVREEAEAAQAALVAAHGEIDRLTARLASTRNELEGVLAARHKEAEERRELKAALTAAMDGRPVVAQDPSEVDRVLRARQREADESELIGIAARAFNRSPHLERVRELAIRQGRPKVVLGVRGVGLPRRVFITFTFNGEPRMFIVSLDLVARSASVARGSAEDRDAGTDRPGRWSPEVGIELAG